LQHNDGYHRNKSQDERIFHQGLTAPIFFAGKHRKDFGCHFFSPPFLKKIRNLKILGR
jgi:hypothetical protein